MRFLKSQLQDPIFQLRWQTQLYYWGQWMQRVTLAMLMAITTGVPAASLRYPLAVAQQLQERMRLVINQVHPVNVIAGYDYFSHVPITRRVRSSVNIKLPNSFLASCMLT